MLVFNGVPRQTNCLGPAFVGSDRLKSSKHPPLQFRLQIHMLYDSVSTWDSAAQRCQRVKAPHGKRRLQLFGSIFYAGRIWLRVVDNLLRTTPVIAESPQSKRNNLRTSKLWVYSLEHLELDLALSFWNICMAMRPDATPATLNVIRMALCIFDQYMMPYSFERALRKLAAAVVVNAMHQCECIACRF